jgi:hypothetical protein
MHKQKARWTSSRQRAGSCDCCLAQLHTSHPRHVRVMMVMMAASQHAPLTLWDVDFDVKNLRSSKTRWESFDFLITDWYRIRALT